MNSQDDHIRRLLIESLDAELGDRATAPTENPAAPTVASGPDRHVAPDARRRRRWALPAVAAASVAAIAVATVALTAHTGHGSNPTGSSKETVVTCAPAGAGSAAADRPALLSRAAHLGDGKPSATVQGRDIVVTVPGASRHDVSALCESSSVQLRPLIAPAVSNADGARTHPLRGLGFPAPTTQAAYGRLTAAQQDTLARRLREADCSHASAGARAPIVSCTTSGDGPREAVLLGAIVIDGDSIASARAQAPATSSTGSTTAWSVDLTFDRHGDQAWSTFTGRHHSSGTTTTTLNTCSATTVPCEDYVAFLTDGVVVTAPLTQSRIESNTQVSGNFTEREARHLAERIRGGDLPVPLRLVSVRHSG